MSQGIDCTLILYTIKFSSHIMLWTGVLMALCWRDNVNCTPHTVKMNFMP